MDYNNMDIVMIGSDQAIPEEKRPALPIKVVKKDSKKNHFLIKILHPNKTPEGVHEVLYEAVHRIAPPESGDQIEHFNLAQEKANEIVDTKFANLETRHEEILHIPAGKKGKMQLKLKGAKKETKDENKLESKTNTQKKDPKKSAKKVAKKKTTRKVTKKAPTKKVAKKKVSKRITKKAPSKRVTKKKTSKKTTARGRNAKKVAKKKGKK